MTWLFHSPRSDVPLQWRSSFGPVDKAREFEELILGSENLLQHFDFCQSQNAKKPEIRNAAQLASFSVEEEDWSRIVTPGYAPVFKPPNTTIKLEIDRSLTAIRPLQIRSFPFYDHLHAVIKFTHPEFDFNSIDIVITGACLSDLHKTFEWQSRDNDVHCDVDIDGKIIYLAPHKDVGVPRTQPIPWKGICFKHACVIEPAETRRIITYELGDLKFMLLNPVDARLALPHEASSAVELPNGQSVTGSDSAKIGSSVESGDLNAVCDDSEKFLFYLRTGGVETDRHNDIHIRPRWYKKPLGTDLLKDLWLRQQKHLCVGWYDEKSYTQHPLEVQDCSEEVASWENTYKGQNEAFVRLLQAIREAAMEHGDNESFQLFCTCHGPGDWSVDMRKSKRAKIFSDVLHFEKLEQS